MYMSLHSILSDKIFMGCFLNLVEYLGGAHMRGFFEKCRRRQEKREKAQNASFFCIEICGGLRPIFQDVELEESFTCMYGGSRNSFRIESYARTKFRISISLVLINYNRIDCGFTYGCDHTSTNAPDPIRTPKLSVLGRE